MIPLTSSDQSLISYAQDFITKHFDPTYHKIATAILTSDGQMFAAFNLDASVGRMAVCAESFALYKAVEEGNLKLETLVSVRHPVADEGFAVVSPCGICREMLYDYAPQVQVIMRDGQRLYKAGLSEILPLPYKLSKPVASS